MCVFLFARQILVPIWFATLRRVWGVISRVIASIIIKLFPSFDGVCQV